MSPTDRLITADLGASDNRRSVVTHRAVEACENMRLLYNPVHNKSRLSSHPSNCCAMESVQQEQVICLREIELKLLSPMPHCDIPAESKIFAQIVINHTIFLHSIPVDGFNKQKDSCKLVINCDIPQSFEFFYVAILHQTGVNVTHLLGTMDMSRNEILTKCQDCQSLEISYTLCKVNDDGPNLFSATSFSVLLPKHWQTQRLRLPFKTDICGLEEYSLNPDPNLVYPQVQGMQTSSETNSTIDPLLIATIHSRILLMRCAVEMKASLLSVGGDICSTHSESAAVDVLGRAIGMYKDAVRLTPAPQASLLYNLAIALSDQFEQKGDLNDLEESILYHQQALKLRPAAHPDRSTSLDNLGIAIHTRFEQKGDFNDLEESIQYHQEALELRPAPHPDQSTSLNNLATAVHTRFEQTGDLNDLEESIQYHRQALELRPAPHPDRSISLNNLATAVYTQFEEKGDLTDLEECIQYHQQALELTPVSHPDRSMSLNNLATALSTRFEHKGDLNDLEESIQCHQEALELMPAPHAERSTVLNSLATALSTRFEQRGDLNDLEESIRHSQQALELTPAPHPQRSSSLNNLATALSIQFEHKGDLKDLEESIEYYQEALELTPASHPERSSSLNNLATALNTRFEQKGDFNDLEKSIQYHQQALELRPAPHPHRSNSLNNVATALRARFEQKGDLHDLEKSIQYHQQALKLRAAPHPDRSTSLDNFASALSTRFDQKGDLNDLEESIQCYQQALELRPAPHPHRSDSLNNLAIALSTRFKQRRNFNDLEESIKCHQQALELTPVPHSERSSLLSNLATALSTRFEEKGDLNDLEESIQYNQQALELMPAPYPQSNLLSNLAVALSIRFEQGGDFNDLEKSIQYHHQALELRPAPHPHRSNTLDNLASVLSTRFEHKGDLNDLEESIQCHQEALELMPAPHADRSTLLNNLATGLSTRFKQKGDLNDLDESIEYYQQAFKLRPDRSNLLNNLATGLSTRFKQRGDLNDLETSIQYHQQALDLRPVHHPARSHSLNALATALSTQFEQKGDLCDLEQSIQYHQQALALRPAPHPDRSISLDNLASTLSTRFKQKGDFNDLDESIQYHQQALELRPAPHPYRSSSLNNLATALNIQYEQKGDLDDLEKSIQYLQQALELRPAPHADRSTWLNNLATGLGRRFEQKGDLNDLEESIQCHQEALEQTPAPHSDRSNSLNNFATVLRARFEQKGDLHDLEKSIQYHQQALELTPAPHSDRYILLNNCALALYTRFKEKDDLNDLKSAIASFQEVLHMLPPDHPQQSIAANLGQSLIHLYMKDNLSDHLEDAMHAYQHAAMTITAPLLRRFKSACEWACMADNFHHASALNAFQHATTLLPLLASLDMSLHDRYKVLIQIQGFASMVCSWAIRSGRLEAAVEYLSAARAVFWSQALSLRTSLDDLEAKNPALAKRLQDIASELEHVAHHTTSSPEKLTDYGKAVVNEAIHCRDLVEQRNSVLRQIRELPGFGDFLLPAPFSKLCQAALNGPIVILNVDDTQCDALLVENHDVKHIPILDLTQDLIENFCQITQDALASKGIRADLCGHDDVETDLFWTQIRHKHGRKASQIPDIGQTPEDKFHFVLNALWSAIATPIINILNLKSSESPPHIWLCPTGPFAFLPIHAAGVYTSEKQTCFSDYATISYTPTLEALLNPPKLQPTLEGFKMLVVIEPGAGRHYLPATVTELKQIKAHVPHEWLTAFGTHDSLSNVDQVTNSLSTTTFAHFACHGLQSDQHPLESALILHDGQLKISQIMEKPMQNASLAFLSACETAKGDKSTPDEVIHLSASLLFAGFSGVVGTMWEIQDEDAPHIVDVFYKHLFRKGRESIPDPTEAADALHLAVKSLRVDKKVGFERWVPFIHFGM